VAADTAAPAGVSGFLGYNQPNLFGQAKQAALQAEYGYGRSSFTRRTPTRRSSERRNSASVSLFHTDDRYRGFSFTDGRYVRTGGSLRYGFPGLRDALDAGLRGVFALPLQLRGADAEDCEVGNIFCQPSAIASNLSLAVTRDTKNHPLFPTRARGRTSRSSRPVVRWAATATSRS
jgi:outer membrane protein assembly factor BamA